MNDVKQLLMNDFHIHPEILERIEEKERALESSFLEIEKTCSYNQLKVLHSFQKNMLSQSDFFSATGYGYGDTGRGKAEAIFRDVFKAEDCLVRPSIASGTHALAIVFFALLEKGDTLLEATDHPYDTLQKVIGIRGEEKGNLIEKGIHYQVLSLKKDHSIDYDRLKEAFEKPVKMVELQRSTGYTDRRAFTMEEMEKAIEIIKKASPQTIIMVDNCYGEFTQKIEPLEIGADIMAGSLIKNPGGGIALSGGYIAGKKDLIERCINHITAPGLGRNTGLTFDTTRLTLQGFFLAPHITKEARKAALLFASVFQEEGFECIPSLSDPRSDIVQAIKFKDPDLLIAFCRAVQKAASVGSEVVPYPWDMPGYSNQIIMASGGFIDGSSIEVSADGPIRPPYIAYYQGGIVYEQAKLACMLALQDVRKEIAKKR